MNPDDEVVPLGKWGQKIPVTEHVHITRTNHSSDDGYGAHVTTNIPGLPIKIHDRFDSLGGSIGSDFGLR